MNHNPFASPKTESNDPTESVLLADKQCPVCKKNVSNWEIMNVAWRYKCEQCENTLTVQFNNQWLNSIERWFWLFLLAPYVIMPFADNTSLHLLAWISLCGALSLIAVLRLNYGRIACHADTTQDN